MKSAHWLLSLLILLLFGTLILIGFLFLPRGSTPIVLENEARHVFGSVTAQGVAHTPPPKEISLIAVGDNMLSRDVGRKIDAKGTHYPYEKVHRFLSSADIVFGNLETPLTTGPFVPSSSMTFHSDPRVVEGLTFAPFSILCLANNHTPNYGERGLRDTFAHLKDAGIPTVGAGKNAGEAEAATYITRQGITLAFLAYNDTDVVPASYGATATRAGTNFMDVKKLPNAVRTAHEHADFVIVSMHSGTEYTAHANTSQKTFAHAAIDAGADLVIGAHPHVVQPLEKYKNKFILYSLGNFVFDQMWSEQTRRGLATKIFFTKERITKLEFYPVRIYDYAQPQLMEGADAQNVLKRLEYPLTNNAVIPEL